MPEPIRIAYTIPYGAQFGANRANGTRKHQGTDYHCPIGTPIYATGDGRVVSNVVESGVGVGYGNYVEVVYPGGRLTLDGHLRERSPLPVGAPVNSDTIVGYVGITGNAIYADPPGSHDHHQVWLNGVLTDPAGYYGTSTAGSDATKITPDIPPIPEQDDDMKFLYVDDDGNGKAVWVLLSTRTAKIVTTYDQPAANGWATVWGTAQIVARQDFLNAIDAIQKTE